MRVDVDVDLDGPVHGRGWSMDVDGRSTCVDGGLLLQVVEQNLRKEGCKFYHDLVTMIRKDL